MSANYSGIILVWDWQLCDLVLAQQTHTREWIQLAFVDTISPKWRIQTLPSWWMWPWRVCCKINQALVVCWSNYTRPIFWLLVIKPPFRSSHSVRTLKGVLSCYGLSLSTNISEISNIISPVVWHVSFCSIFLGWLAQDLGDTLTSSEWGKFEIKI